MRTKKVEVVQDFENPIPVKILAESIKSIAEGYRKLRASGLNDRAITVLLKDATGVPSIKIRMVMQALSQLDRLYLK